MHGSALGVMQGGRKMVEVRTALTGLVRLSIAKSCCHQNLDRTIFAADATNRVGCDRDRSEQLTLCLVAQSF